MSFNNSISDGIRKPKNEEIDGPSETLLMPKNKEKIMSKPVVIPSSVNMTGGKKLSRVKPQQVKVPVPEKMEEPEVNNQNLNIEQSDFEEIKTVSEEPETVTVPVVEPPKKRRGRPRKNPLPETNNTETPATPVKRGRGRPRKNPTPVEQELPKPEIEENNSSVLPGLDEEPQVEEPVETLLPGISEEPTTFNESNNQFNNNFDDFNIANDTIRSEEESYKPVPQDKINYSATGAIPARLATE